MSDVILHEPVSELITAGEWAKDAFRRTWDAATAALDAGMYS